MDVLYWKFPIETLIRNDFAQVYSIDDKADKRVQNLNVAETEITVSVD